jgi:hypothetical protein
MEVGITGKICWPFLARFPSSLTETSHVAWRGAPLEMMEGTKGGAQRARSLRPRCIREVVPGPWRQSTIYLSRWERINCQLPTCRYNTWEAPLYTVNHSYNYSNPVVEYQTAQHRCLLPLSSLLITFNSSEIAYSSELQFLVLFVTGNLAWHVEMHPLCASLSQIYYMVKSLRNVTSNHMISQP